MRAHLLVCRGLPASGKTTWARDMVGRNPAIHRISKDDLRTMLDNGVYSPANELLVCRVRDSIIREVLAGGATAIVDDTNLNPVHIEHFRQMTRELSAPKCGIGPVKMHVVDFTREADVTECVRRDGLREKAVGEAVIRGMWERWLRPARGTK